MENQATKKDLVRQVAEEMNISIKQAEVTVNTFLGKLENALLEGNKVRLHDFGIFEVKERAARQGRNPRNPQEIIDIPASKAVTFKVSKPLRDKVKYQ